MVGAKRVLETRVCRAGIHEICPAELSHIAETLKDVGIYELEGLLIDSNVVPDGIAQYLEAHAPPRRRRYPFGPAFFVATSTLPNFSKFARNIPASLFAWASYAAVSVHAVRGLRTFPGTPSTS